ncbi:NAD(P)H-dependent flavin oxidoreductase (plasmid) [Roseomonas sp. CCTCC AB2023176]|uniref:NAD(P)H-dependent flavin oxidoreductase n=1 Tax=Roseomonas sp. CCTCC AB2023176 TaxID=3342640 RepID=UPI0035DF9494
MTGLPFRLRLPVCAAPMFLVSGPDLVVAASRAGIMGALPTSNARTTQELELWFDAIRTGLSDRPGPAVWAANLVTHSSNARLAADLELVARYRPPVVITALGSPRPAIDVVHAYGGLVIGDVTTLRLARKAIAAGVDGLACICAGAGGHTGALSPFAFISAVRATFDGLIIAGGGVADGHGIAGAIAAGADLVYVGTAFIPAEESVAPQEHKQLVVDATLEDLVVSAAFTGAPASWLSASIRGVGMDPDRLPPDLAGYAGDVSKRPKRWKEVLSAGQGVGAVHGIVPVSAIVDRLESEYRDATARAMRLFHDAAAVSA